MLRWFFDNNEARIKNKKKKKKKIITSKIKKANHSI